MNTKAVRISEMQAADRPRERLVRSGASALSDTELLAILLGSGGRGRDVMTLAAKVLSVVDEKGLAIECSDLSKIMGVGSAKAAVILSALEFSRRRIASEGRKVRAPEDILEVVGHLLDRKQETFVCISLNGAHEVIASRIVTIGLVNACQVHPREVFAEPITDRASAIIVAHNHPSGDLTPSEQDRLVTRRLKDAADLLGIRFLDHIIFSKRGVFSFHESGQI